MMKKLVTFSLFLFLSGSVGIVVAGFLASQQKCAAPVPLAGLPATNNSTNTPVTAGKAEFVLSAGEVAKHGKGSDCWEIIDGKVYDFTSYLNQHPGGADIVIAYCGQEASNAFATKGGQGRNHSDFARKLLANYLVGNLNQKISGTAADLTQRQATSGTNPAAATSQVTATPTASTNANGNVTLTASEIAKHNSAGSCWLIVSGKIYDVSGYLGKHPAGAGAIIPYCGKDATDAFSGSSGGHAHSGFAWGLLGGFYIGTVGEQTTSTAIQQNAQQAQSAAQQSPTGGGEDDD